MLRDALELSFNHRDLEIFNLILSYAKRTSLDVKKDFIDSSKENTASMLARSFYEGMEEMNLALVTFAREEIDDGKFLCDFFDQRWTALSDTIYRGRIKVLDQI